MKIAFDGKRLFHNHTGLGNYSRSLVSNIRALDSSNKLFLLAQHIDSTEYSTFTNGDYELCDGKGRFLWRLKNMVQDIRTIQPEIYHGLSNELPVGIGKLKSTKSIVTVHDLIFLIYPEFYPRVDRILYKEKSKRACKVADHIIAVSEATKKDIVSFFQIDPDKISVIYQACDALFYKPQQKQARTVQERPYILFVSSITERKNLSLILESMSLLKKNRRPLLKVVGTGKSYQKLMKNLVHELNLTDDVSFLGHLDSKQLQTEYVHALCTVYPSIYEGFGIPIVESMLCGTPVITSDVSSMPEAAAGLGVLIDPYSAEDLAVAIGNQMDEPHRLSEAEINLVKNRFSPRVHAEKVIETYKYIL